MKISKSEARNPKRVGNSNDLRKSFQQEGTERDFSKTLFSLLSPVKSLMHSLQSNSRKPILSFDQSDLFRVSIFGFRILLFCILFAPVPAFAHVQGAEALGFFSGLAHPVSGLDHVLAMIAVGLWGAQLGAPAIWVLPIAFPLVMAAGGMLGLIGVSIPGIEYGIAASAILLGTAVAFEVRPSIVIAALLVGVFAIFHGHAHGTELPPGQSALLYSIGFVIATGCLHGLGIGVGAVHQWAWGQKLLRTAGAAVAVGGVVFMWRALV
jgi:urease accessory protein